MSKRSFASWSGQVPWFEALERRVLLSAVSATGFEVYLTELVNRARADPSSEAARFAIDLNEGLSPGTISSAPKAPLAVNPYLTDAAQRYSDYQLANDLFAHNSPGNPAGETAGERMASAGFGTEGSFGWGENLSLRVSSGSLPVDTAAIDDIHEGLFRSSGHRQNMLDGSFKEIGAGVRTGTDYVFDGQSWNHAILGTEKFAHKFDDAFLTGVVYDDSLVLDNDFYTPGEGIDQRTITATRDGDGQTFQASSGEHGEFRLQVPDGTYDVVVSGLRDGVRSFTDVVVSGENVKLDFVGQAAEPEIAVEGDGQTISDGDVSPSGDDGTDFGFMAVSTGAATRAYTIRNTGDHDLSIDQIRLTGAAASDFTVTDAGDATVSPGGSTTITVAFDPSEAGAREATLEILSNDQDEATFDFAVRGQGLAATDLGQGVLGATLEAGAGDAASDGELLLMHFTGTLTDGTQFDSSRPTENPFRFTLGQGQVINGWEIGIEGMQPGERRVLIIPPEQAYGSTGSPPSIPPDATLIFDVERLPDQPDIVVTREGGTRLAPSAQVDLGAANVGNTISSRFQITNGGTATLSLTATPFVQLIGPNADQFDLVQPSSDNSFVFEVRFRPTVPGSHTAFLSIPNNDPNESGYTLQFSGTAQAWWTQTGRSLSFDGTSGDDTIVIDASPSGRVRVALNGAATSFLTANIDSFLFNGFAGSDTVTLTGDPTANTVRLNAKGQSGVLFGNGFAATVVDAENITVKGDGADSIEFIDSPGDDRLVSFPERATFTGGGVSFTAEGFGAVRGFARHGGADFAELYDTAGDDTLRHRSGFTDMISSGRYRFVQDFEKVNGYATRGGNDAVEFVGVDGRDHLRSFPTFTTMGRGDGGSRYASGFDRVTGRELDSQDFAEIWDTAGDDHTRSFASFTDMQSAGLYRRVDSTGKVNTYAVNGGSDDFVEFWDSSGDDRFRSRAEFTTLVGPGGVLRYASGYDRVNGYAVNGGRDLAELWDSAGDDHMRSFAEFTTLRTTGGSSAPARYVSEFEQVNGYAINGGDDFAELYDTSGDDSLRRFTSFTDLTSTGPGVSLYRYISGFERVNSYALFGGDDTANFFDAPGADDFFGKGNFGQLNSPGANLLTYVSGYERINLDGSNGGANTRRLDPGGVSYVLQEVGLWS